jgi:hypothetical protein
MLRRAFLGLFEGLVIGLGLAVLSAQLGLSAPGGIMRALLAAGVGFLVGLVAGRPVWARAAKTEALLKAGVGALVAAGLSLALGRWLTLPVNLTAYGLGAGAAGGLAAVSLPAIACALALFFELDDTTGSAAPAPLPGASSKQRLAANELDQLDQPGELEALDDEAAHKTKKR